MNFLADESVDFQIVDRLRQEGHLVRYIAEIEAGVSDDVVLNLANKEASLLLTADKDFGELIFRQHRLAEGVILIRLAGLSPMSKAEIVTSTSGNIPQSYRKPLLSLHHRLSVFVHEAIEEQTSTPPFHQNPNSLLYSSTTCLLTRA
jgi:predicted nuclease of predicted toxin-antitoxin system